LEVLAIFLETIQITDTPGDKWYQFNSNYMLGGIEAEKIQKQPIQKLNKQTDKIREKKNVNIMPASRVFEAKSQLS